MTLNLQQKGPVRWILPREAQKGMRVPGLIYGDAETVRGMEGEKSLQQVANVATLPGIIGYSYCMPDIHQGYGFPIGGVAAFDEDEGIISPGGVGYDISCGVRLMASDAEIDEVRPHVRELTARLFSSVPCGVGSHGAVKLNRKELIAVLRKGALWAVEKGLGDGEDLRSIEKGGTLENTDPSAVSQRALERGQNQLGTLGSGNHFIEIQVVDRIFDLAVARRFGLQEGQITLMVHCGSRGLGHQVCDDQIRIMLNAMKRYGIAVPDRQLCCAPLDSPEGRCYMSAMRAAANFALANREVIGHHLRESFRKCLPGRAIRLLYDVSHNMAHMEEHLWEGRRRRLCVHRKGATRALPPGHPELPDHLKPAGQPVLIPGSMGTASYVLVGTARGAEECFASTCHGAGRRLSRHASRNETSAGGLVRDLEARGIFVQAESLRTLEEEAPQAYKDVDSVVDIVERAGISRKVARLRPLAVIKG